MNNFQTIPTASIIGMVVSTIISICLPLVLMILWRIKKKAGLGYFFLGAATFVIFVFFLEQTMHTVVLSSTGNTISGNVWLYGLYGGIAAGLFEEAGRFIAMKFIMKKKLNKQNAIMYGIGHGGIESIILVGITMLSNLAVSIMINTGNESMILAGIPAEQKDGFVESLAPLWTTGSINFYMGGVERITAIFLHICLSYLVYRAIRYNKPIWWFAAFGIHTLVDMGSIYLVNGLGCPILLFEIILVVLIATLTITVVKAYSKEPEPNT